MGRVTFTVLGRKAARIRARAVAQGKLCHWCKRRMILPGDPGYLRKSSLPSKLGATIDHLYSRGHPLRQTVGGSVIACWKCNQKRGAAEERARRRGALEPRIYRPEEVHGA